MARNFEKHDLSILMSKVNEFDIWNLYPTIEKDLSKVDFDFENYEHTEGCGYNGCKDITGFHVTSNGLPYWGWTAGGDWEVPVFFIIYWDGKSLRGYIPKDGNTWNTDTKQAYGNDEKADAKNIKKRWPERFKDHKLEEIMYDSCPFCDPKLILEDIEKRIQPKK